MTKGKRLSANRLWKRCTASSRSMVQRGHPARAPTSGERLGKFAEYGGGDSPSAHAKRGADISAPRNVLAFKLLYFLFGIGFSGYSFAALVAYRAARFAGGLASRPAFAAACDLLFSGFCYRSYHFGVLLFRNYNIYFLYYIISACKNQVFLQAEIRRRTARRNNFARQPSDRGYARLRLTASTPVIPPAKAQMSASSS